MKAAEINKYGKRDVVEIKKVSKPEISEGNEIK